MPDQELARPQPELQPADVELLRLLPHTIHRVPMKRAKVDAATLRRLAYVEALRMRGLVATTRTFPGQGVFTLAVMLTPAGAEAVRRHRS